MSSINTETGRLNYLSYSSANTFRQCRRRWKLKYIDDLPDSRSEASLRGVFVHAVLEDLLDEEPEARTVERARELAGELWGAFRHDVADLGLDDKSERSLKWVAWQDIEGYFELVNPKLVDVIGTEYDVETDLDDGDTQVRIRAIIDLIDRDPDGVVNVTDYKTGKVPPAGRVEDRLEQVRLYAAACHSGILDEPVTNVRLLYTGETGQRVRRPTLIERRVTQEHEQAAVAKHCSTWNQIHAAIDDNSFEPAPSPLCGWCAYQQHCPEGARVAKFHRS